MINIVGMEHYSDGAKSEDFEGPIQEQFRVLDGHVHHLRLSNFVKKARAGDKDIDEKDRQEVEVAAQQVFRDTALQRQTMYFFVRCFSSTETTKVTHCDLQPYIAEQLAKKTRGDPTIQK